MARTPEEIEEGLKQNSPAAIEYLYQTFWDACIREIRKDGGRREDGEDVFQMSIVSLMDSIRAGRYKSGNLFGYFKVIIKHTWRRQLRRKGRLPLTDLAEAEEVAVEQKLMRFRTSDLVHQYVHQLSDSCRELFYGVYWGEMKQKEIAEEENMEYGSVRARLTKCRRSLFELLKKDPTFQHLAQSS
ncbi:MAG: sigma-70 family RNA polymerase sigma factor [Bacteroidota bacterium]